MCCCRGGGEGLSPVEESETRDEGLHLVLSVERYLSSRGFSQWIGQSWNGVLSFNRAERRDISKGGETVKGWR